MNQIPRRRIRVVALVVLIVALISGDTTQANAAGWTEEAAAPLPSRSDTGQFFGVSCTTPDECVAVGRLIVEDGPDLALAQHRVGGAWVQRTVPLPAGALEGELRSVSCVKPTACMAVGYVLTSSAYVGLIARFDGAAWTSRFAPKPRRLPYALLDDISCAPETKLLNCVAVGFELDGDVADPFVLHWRASDGWRVANLPSLPTESEVFTGVSCRTPSACMAVGLVATSTNRRPLSAWWNGTTWSVLATPSPRLAAHATLADVSCATERLCVAVGGSTRDDSRFSTLVEEWTGEWAVVESPPKTNLASVELRSVSCPEPHNCIAVGSRSPLGGDVTGGLILRQANAVWETEPPASVAGAQHVFLQNVSCVTRNACTAVGEKGPGGIRVVPLIQRY